MNWFQRTMKGILTHSNKKKTINDGVWFKLQNGKIVSIDELKNNCYVNPSDNFHVRINPKQYFEIIFDDNKFVEIGADLTSKDYFNFSDLKTYESRLTESKNKTGQEEAVRVAYGEMNKKKIVVACLNFNFIGGTMGLTVGKKLCLAIDKAYSKKIPLLIISKSGGARLMEGGVSLMQMGIVATKLLSLKEKKIPYISLMTDPTMGGVTASFAMLGDFNIAEPGALIGFAGPRVIRDTVKMDLPKGFQSAEFLLEHGFIDFIVDRRELKDKLYKLINMLS